MISAQQLLERLLQEHYVFRAVAIGPTLTAIAQTAIDEEVILFSREYAGQSLAHDYWRRSASTDGCVKFL